jgi:hypothetical protein
MNEELLVSLLGLKEKKFILISEDYYNYGNCSH